MNMLLSLPNMLSHPKGLCIWTPRITLKWPETLSCIGAERALRMIKALKIPGWFDFDLEELCVFFPFTPRSVLFRDVRPCW